MHLCQDRVSKHTEEILMMQTILKKNHTNDLFRETHISKNNDLEMILKPKYSKYIQSKLRLRKLKIQK